MVFWGYLSLSNLKALTKIQSIILIAIIVVALVIGGAAYVILSGQDQSSETIKIGVCTDLETTTGDAIWQGVVLAIEQVNAEGGVLGRKFEIVGEDSDFATTMGDINFASNALTRLITVDKADFIIASGDAPPAAISYQEIVAIHKKILLMTSVSDDVLTQRVLDDYSKYKYFFRTGIPNSTSGVDGITESIVTCRELTGLNKVAFLYHGVVSDLTSSLVDTLDDYGFDVVHTQQVMYDVVDFSSCFAQAEAAGAEILYPFIFGESGIYFVKEYYDRQSPMVMWGMVSIGSTNDFWQITDGKCEHITNNGYPVVIGYPLTSKTVATREAYIERWGEEISGSAAAAYDTVRFILVDAIERAGTIETDAVIEALEETEVETSLARRFLFTSSHDVMIGEAGPNRPTEDYFLVAMFQWQDGVQVPVCPIELMEEAGATYLFPPWSGPWDNLD